jgi:hypothetical protein
LQITESTSAGKDVSAYFANPTGGRYDQDDVALAWARTHTFLATYLR